MDNSTIGKKIIKVRKMLGLTQKEFGLRLGVTKQALSSWEHGRTLPDIIILTEIAAMFGMNHPGAAEDIGQLGLTFEKGCHFGQGGRLIERVVGIEHQDETFLAIGFAQT